MERTLEKRDWNLEIQNNIENGGALDFDKQQGEESFGKELKEVLKNKNIKIEDFAKSIFSCRTTIYLYIRNERIPKFVTVKRMEEILGVKFSEYYPSIDNAKTFGDKLKVIMEYKGITRAELAKKINKNYAEVSDYVNDKKIPKLKTLKKLEKIGEISFKEYYPDFDNESTFGDKLKKGIREKELTVEQFAVMTGKSKSAIGYYIRNNIPDITMLKKMESILEISFSEYYPKEKPKKTNRRKSKSAGKCKKTKKTKSNKKEIGVSSIMDDKKSPKIEKMKKTEKKAKVPFSQYYADLRTENSFGEKLRLGIEYNEITISKFAKIIEKSRSTIYNYMSSNIPKIDTIKKIENVLGISFSEYYNSIDNSKTFGENLKLAMEYKGITRVEVAKKIHKKDVVVSSYIENKKFPGIKTMKKLEEILDVSFSKYYPDFNNEKNFEEKLKKAIKWNEITTKEFAHLLGVSEVTVYKYLRGYVPKIFMLKRIENILNVSFSEYYPDINIADTFGEKLKLAMKLNEISVKELAITIGKDKTMIYKYIKGHMPKIYTIKKMEKALNISFKEYYPESEKNKN